MKRRYMVTIRYAADALDRERIISSGRAIKDYIERMSENECKLAWTSTDGAAFGYLMKSDLSAKKIFLGLMYPGQTDFRQEWRPADSDPGLSSTIDRNSTRLNSSH